MRAETTDIRVVIVTLDGHLAGSVARARDALRTQMPGLKLTLHAAADFIDDEAALDRCREDIARADIILATMLFLDEHIQAILPALKARRDDARALIGAMSGAEIIKLTRMGSLAMGGEAKGPLALLKRLRGSKSKTGGSSGAGQMKMLKRLPKLLRFIPGTAQDLRAYFLTLQYWLAGSDENVQDLVRMLVGRYGPEGLKGTVAAAPPRDYPEVGLHHPGLDGAVTQKRADLPTTKNAKGSVGLVLLRSYILAGDAGHYDGVITAMAARGLDVVPVFASGLDARPAIDAYFKDKKGRPTVDAVVSLTGFSLVGGPAYNDAGAAEEALCALDVPYLAAHPLEFQSLERWGGGDAGLTPVEATMMVALPELDGAANPILFGGRSDGRGEPCAGCERGCVFEADGEVRAMRACMERADALAAKVEKLIALRRAAAADRRIAVTLFNFPPNGGAVGTAAYLSVFESLAQTLKRLQAEGYDVGEAPFDADALRRAVLTGNAETYGADANVEALINADDHVRREPHLEAIEEQWGPAPGRVLTNGSKLFVLGKRFGNVFVGVQPGFGYEGDPMRLLFEKGFAPTHAFSAYYRWLREDFAAHAVLHFGTHGALEFMPGRQTALGARDWPERLIGDLPNIYLYAGNNPSEGMIAKRRSGAVLVSHMTPPLAQAGLYKGLTELKSSLDRRRGLGPEAGVERARLAEAIQHQGAALDLCAAEPAWNDKADGACDALLNDVREMEESLIPDGLHVAGRTPDRAARRDLLAAIAQANDGPAPSADALDALVDGAAPAALSDDPETRAAFAKLAEVNAKLTVNGEFDGLLRALRGGYVPPAPGGDLIRNPDVLPTGRNLHGFDPYRMPTAFAVKDGAAQAARLLARHEEDTGAPPESVAVVLWGSDNLKNDGAPIAQALALIGAKPRVDGYGRVCGAELISLEELGRPRIDTIMTLSGIFRDLLPLQARMLAEAAYLAATAEEPANRNFVRKHALAYAQAKGCDLETAALRVFSNAEGAYGANVNLMLDGGLWEGEDELADAYEARKCFAYGRKGEPKPQGALLQSALKTVDLAYQNLESVELGVTTIDHYVDTLGGIARAVKRAKDGEEAPVYISDQTQGDGVVRSLKEKVALETHTRMLNPRWYEGVLRHGYEGVRQIEAQMTNTMGWSATTGEVQPWVYQRITETYVLDPDMRARLAELNPKASVKLTNRLIEAFERNYWSPDDATLDALRAAGEELEDRLEGVLPEGTQAA